MMFQLKDVQEGDTGRGINSTDDPLLALPFGSSPKDLSQARRLRKCGFSTASICDAVILFGAAKNSRSFNMHVSRMLVDSRGYCAGRMIFAAREPGGEDHLDAPDRVFSDS